MSFAQEEEELDWGDAVDVVSLGDEEEIPYTAPQVAENEVQEPAPTVCTPEEAPEPAPSSAKSRAAASSIHALGLSHLPPKPRTVVSGRRSRETITAAAMSRSLLNSRSSPGSSQNEASRNWETRRPEHTEHHTTSHLKRQRDDTRLDKDYREGEAPLSSSDRLHTARNASSGRAAWPERSPAHHSKSSARTVTPSSREESPPPRPRSPDAPSRQKPNAVPPRPRSMSPSSMLIPRRGQSPARGLAKHSNNTSAQGPYDTPDDGYSNGSRESYPDRYRESGRNRNSRNDRDTRSRTDHYTAGAHIDRSSRVDDVTNAIFPRETREDSRRQRERDVANGTTDHYSPPPEGDDARPRHDSRRRSVSPPRQTAMRSDGMVSNQRARRSLSPRDQGDARAYGRPALERVATDSHIDRGYTRGRTIDDGGLSRNRRPGEHDGRRSGVDYVDHRDEQFRGRDMRIPGQIPHVSPAPSAPISLHTREVEQLPPDAGDSRFHGPAQFRDERFPARPDNRRMHSSRSGHVQAPRVDPSSEAPRLSPHNTRNNVPLPPRHDFVAPHEGTPHGRGRNGEMRDRGMLGDCDTMDQRREHLPLNHEGIAMPPEGHELHHEDLVRQHRHHHTGSREEYMAVDEPPPPELHERHLASANPSRRGYTARNRDFPPHQASGTHEPEFSEAPDFRPREPGHFPTTEHRGRGASFTRSHPQDVISHDYEPSSLPHGHHLPLHEPGSISSNRGYQVAESQRRDQPTGRRDTYPGRYDQDGQLIDRTSRTWERGIDVPTPPPEESRHRGRRHHSDARRPQREVVSDTEYLEARGAGRVHPEGGRVSYDDMTKDIHSARRPQHNAKQSYGPENRGWVPRDAPPHQEMSSVTHMEIDHHEGAPLPPGESLPGWAGPHRRDRSPQARNQTRQYRPRPGARETWPPPPDHDRGMVGTESGPEGKRQKVDGGTRAINTFSRDEGELPRKVPQHSPIQRPKPRSPVNTFAPLPQPVIAPPTVIPKVDIEAARARARNVASQLGLVNPTARAKSRFDQLLPDSTPAILVTNSSESQSNSGPVISSDPNAQRPFAHDSSTLVGVKENQSSRLEEPRNDRQGSADSSDPLVASMGGANLGDSERAGMSQEGLGRPNMYRNSRLDSSFPKRDRNRTDPPRNGNGNNGNRFSKGDAWRSENGGVSRTSGMRAWGQEVITQREAPPHNFSPPMERVFVPRQGNERNFVPREATNRPFAGPEGLPPRPATPPEFFPAMNNSRPRNRANTGGRARSPQRGRPSMTDGEGPAATMEPSGSEPSPADLSFLSAANSPRKSTLLDRMTDPNSGEPLVTRLSGEQQQGGNDGQFQRQPRRSRLNRPPIRR